MTPQEIDNLQAGAELDALVAEKALGLVYEPRFTGDVEGYWVNKDTDDRVISEELPAYSTDMAAAWQVVETLDLISNLSGMTLQYWFQEGWCIYEGYDANGNEGPLVIAETAPLAICRAALKVTNHTSPTP